MKFGYFLFAIISGLFGVLVFNFIGFKRVELIYDMPKGFVTESNILDNEIDEKIFAKSLTFKTITFSENQVFVDFFVYLEESFPNVRKVAERKDFESGVMYLWKGSNKSLEKEPIVFIAHADVVPVAEADLDGWMFGPWDGRIEEDDGEMYIYGRGSLDYKIGVVGMMNAFDLLSKTNFEPKRDIYLLFGFDEETIHGKGARGMAEYFRKNNIRPRFMIDEGGVIQKNQPNIGIDDFVLAVIPLAERGLMNVNISISCTGGHSSRPKRDNECIHKASEVIQKMIDNPIPPRTVKFVIPFINYIFPKSNFLMKFIFSNLRFFPYLIGKAFERDQNSNAILRSTIVPTIINIGHTHNVLPNKGWLLLNCRINPEDSIDLVVDHIQEQISSIDGVKIGNIEEIYSGKDARLSQKISKVGGVEFEMIIHGIRSIFKDKFGEDKILFTPSVMIGGTDLYYYREFTDYGYNFLPVVFDFQKNDIGRIHGNNERLSVDGFKRSVKFYTLLLQNLQLLE